MIHLATAILALGTALTWNYEYRPRIDNGRRNRIDPRLDSFTGREAAHPARPTAGRHRHSRQEFGVLLSLDDVPAFERSFVVHHVAYRPEIE